MSEFPYKITSAAILHNTATDRYHPLLFRASPCATRPDRQRSAGHHTAGFDTLELARAYVRDEYELDAAILLNWDGSDFRLTI